MSVMSQIRSPVRKAEFPNPIIVKYRVTAIVSANVPVCMKSSSHPGILPLTNYLLDLTERHLNSE